VADLGVYLHVPFCRQRCDYCAFATYSDRDHLMQRYLEACRAEVRRAVAAGGLTAATSIFVGGGTPSRVPAEWLCDVVSEVPRRPGAEVTVECNPEDVDAARLATYRAAGVTRISIGVQSTVAHVLGALGRRHGSEQARSAAEMIVDAGFVTWNADLIFGAALEGDEDWRRCLDEVLSWPAPPPHLSAYALTVEPGTPLARSPGRHPDEDAQARRYVITDEVLVAAGYRWEEISNWARPGHGCRHNQLYWRQGDYLGIGSAAHSHRDGHRWWNVRTPDRYVDAISSGRSPVAGEEHLIGDQRAFEGLTLALRTPAGVPAACLPGPDEAPELGPLVDVAGGRAVLTVTGRLLANEVCARLRVGRGVPVSSPG
jgi:putative oxygen-independent coproporphyrinogen III oxidase